MSASRKTVLVVDDDPHLREVVRFALEKGGFTVVEAADGREALRRFDEARPDLVVLDVLMPEMDGTEVCQKLRARARVPIVFLSSKDDEVDRIVGLELGGDDYVTKPFSPRELVARVKAILKRTENHGAPMVDTVLERGKVRLDRGAHEVTHDGVQVPLTALEFAIMAALLGRPAMVFSREQLIEAAYGPQIHVADRTIDSHVRNIRAKFATAGCDVVITTVHGVGFKLGLDGP